MGELFLVPARTNGQHESSSAEIVDCSELFCRDDRVSHRDDKRGDSQLYLVRDCSKIGKCRYAVEDSFIGSSAVFRHQCMVGGPKGVTAGMFGLQGYLTKRLGRGGLAVVWDTYA